MALVKKMATIFADDADVGRCPGQVLSCATLVTVGRAVPLAGALLLCGCGVEDTPSEVSRYLEFTRNAVTDLG